MRKKCLECGEPFNGRTDKKFCGDLCRNAHHNKFNGYRNALIRHVNHKLRRNRGILAELVSREILEINYEELAIMGFDYRFYTQETTLYDNQYKFCYDIGYMIHPDIGTVNIIDKPYKNRRGKTQRAMAAEPNPEYIISQVTGQKHSSELKQSDQP